MERLPKRLESAVTKLYTAFHANKLNAMDGCACAVGNMLDGDRSWEYIRTDLGVLDFDSSSFKNSKKALEAINSSGYSVREILKVEKVFLNAVKIKSIHNHKKYPSKKKKRKIFNYKIPIWSEINSLDCA